MQLLKGKNGRAADKPHMNGKSNGTGVKPDEKLYRPTDKEPFMNERQREYFRRKLNGWKEEILKESRETIQNLQAETVPHADLADRASTEADRGVEQRPTECLGRQARLRLQYVVGENDRRIQVLQKIMDHIAKRARDDGAIGIRHRHHPLPRRR